MITIRLGVILKPKSNHIYVGLLASSFILLFVLSSDYRFSWVGPGSPSVRLLFIPFLSARTLLRLLSKGNTTCRSRLWFISVNVILTLNVFFTLFLQEESSSSLPKDHTENRQIYKLIGRRMSSNLRTKATFFPFCIEKTRKPSRHSFSFREKNASLLSRL